MKPPQFFQTMAHKYGDVFSFKALGYVVVVLNSYETIKEAFQNPLLNDRTPSMIEEGLEPGKISRSKSSCVLGKIIIPRVAVCRQFNIYYSNMVQLIFTSFNIDQCNAAGNEIMG